MPLRNVRPGNRWAQMPVVTEHSRRSWNWRRRPDLNRGSRFCRPLPYHLATAPVGTVCRESPAASMRSNTIPRRRSGRPEQSTDSARNSRSESSSNPCEGWSGKRDSNPRLRPWQGRTLPLSYSRSSAKTQRTTAIFAQSRTRMCAVDTPGTGCSEDQNAGTARRTSKMTAKTRLHSTAA